MRVLMIGDVVGQAGCAHLSRVLPMLRRTYAPDVVIANGENAAEGNGLLPASARQLRESGVDIITSGNHILRRKEIYDILEDEDYILRPANLHSSAPGRGLVIYEGLKFRLCVINLLGTAFMDPLDNPFDTVDRLLEQTDGCNMVIVDFHAEATAEKLCMGFYLDGRASLVVGTHTHVQTADERILPGGTGYITDLGMCGCFNSVLGVKPAGAIRRMRTHLPTRFENDPGEQCLSGILADLDEKTGRTTHIERINIF